MKKLTILAIATCAAVMVSCAGVEGNAEKLAKKILNCKTLIEYDIVEDEVIDYYDSLKTKEEKSQFSDAYEKTIRKIMAEKIEFFAEEFESAKTSKDYLSLYNKISAFYSIVEKEGEEYEFSEALEARVPNFKTIMLGLGLTNFGSSDDDDE